MKPNPPLPTINRIVLVSIVLILILPLACLAQVSETNRVLSLDGDGDYVTIPSAPDLQNPTALTVEFWVNPRLQNRAPRLISKGDGLGETSARSYDIGWNNGDALGVDVFWQVQSGQPNYSVVTTTVASNHWTHVAVVFSSETGVLQVLTNGVVADQQSGLQGRTLRQTSLPLMLGYTPPFTDTYASGYMDEVRIWTVARTEAEIQGDMSCRLSGAEAGLAGYWHFDTGLANDLTGHGHDGSLGGNAAIVAIVGSDVPHEGCSPSTNLVLSLDGDGDYVTIPSAPDLQNPTGLTIEFWMNPRLQNRAPLLISKGDGLGETSERTYDIGWNNGDALGVNFFWQVQSGQPNYSVLTTRIASNVWTHVAVVFSSETGVLQVLTNGVVADHQSGLQGRTVRQTSLPLMLGYAPPFTDTYASGYMDEVRIWSIARTPGNISRDMSCRLTGSESGLAGYWHFDTGLADDATGHGHDGSLAGNAAIIPIIGPDVPHQGCGEAQTSGAFNSVMRLSDGTVLLDFTGDWDTYYRFEASTNLLDWVPFVTLRNADGTFELVDPAAAWLGMRFYRTVKP